MRTWSTVLACLAVGLLALVAWVFVDDDRTSAAVARAAKPSTAASLEAGNEPSASAELASKTASESEAAEREAAQGSVVEAPPQRAKYRGSTRVRGRVLSAEGAAIEGARVLTAEGAKGADQPLDASLWDGRKGRDEAVTDSEGRFEFSKVAAGQFRLAVRASGFAPFDLEHRSVPADEEYDLGELVLTPGVRMGGLVLDQRGAPLADAMLIRVSDAGAVARARTLTDCGVVVARSGADGSFAIDCQAAGPWNLLVHAEDHLDQLASGILTPPGTRRDGLVFQLARSASIDGRVRVAPGPGTPPFELLTIQARRSGGSDSLHVGAQFVRESNCGLDGSFHVGGLLEGDIYVLTARAPLGEKDKRRDLGAPVEAIAGDVDVELVIGTARVLVLGALDAQSGAPVDALEARWFVDSPDGRGRALAVDATVLGDGRVRMVNHDVVDAGVQFAVELAAEGYRTVRLARLDIEPGRETVLALQRMEPLGVARVRVTDARTGEALKGARVSAELTLGDDGKRPIGAPLPQGKQARDRVHGDKARRDGIVELYASFGATALATASHDDYARSELFPLTFGSPDAPPIDVGLSRGGGIEAHVIGPQAEPIVGARVYVNAVLPAPQAAGASVSMTKGAEVTDGTGLCVFESLAAGQYTVRLDLERLGSSKSLDTSAFTAKVDVVAEAYSEVTLRAPPRMRIYGRVIEAGAPVIGAQLTFAAAADADREGRSPSQWRPSVLARTDEYGRYDVPGLGPGNWTIAVEHPSRLVPSYAGVELSRTDVERDIVLSRAAMLGRVVDVEGHGLEGARVVLGFAKGDRDAEFAPLLDGRASVLTDSAGNFEIRGPPSGRRLMLEASLSGFQTARSAAQSIAIDETVAGIELVLRRGARIEVELSTGPNAPVRAFVYAQRLDLKGKPGVNDVRTASSNSRGWVKLDGLTPGRWRISAWRPRDDRRRAPTREVTVEAGATSRVEFEFEL